MRRIVAGVVVVAVLAACGGSSPHRTIVGSLTLNQYQNMAVAPTCHGTGGFDDIHDGAQVLVSDGTGKVLGTSALSNATFASRTRCTFNFTVPALPDVDFYQVEVSHRGKVVHSKKDLIAANWHVDLTIGN